MSKVIIFSRTFPAYHPKAGQPTYFVEKLYNSIYRDATGDWSDALGDVSNYAVKLDHTIMGMKHHTIRAGSRWQAGQKFSPRVWSGVPYQSKQIIIASDIEIEKVWSFEIKDWDIFIDSFLYSGKTNVVSENDGLSGEDFLSWFRFPKPFVGQIICWNDKIKY